MVQPRYKVVLYFAAFVLPALLLYCLFFLYPFGQGIRISFTNWDGLTPRTPISMPKAEFEQRILDRVTTAGDKSFLLGIYHLDGSDNQYKRLYVTGLARYRLQRLLRVVGYQPDLYRTVGFANYAQIFSGKVEQRFYPHSFTKTNFNADSDLPASIPRDELDRNFLPHLASAEDRQLVLRFYAPVKDAYVLAPQYDELALEDRIWLLPEVDQAKTVASTHVDELLSAVKDAGLKTDAAALQAAVGDFLRRNPLSPASAAEVKSASEEIYRLGAVKHLLATEWVEQKFEMGVVGFTLFFTFFNVVLSNLIAFFLALALDRGLKTQKVLRSVFFLPNVLSMIIVALVWSFVFYNLLPALTGIDKWMGDPAKTPWLIVLVQVWQQSGYLMVIYLAGMSTIPTDVLEAASIDGATFRRRLRYITLPLIVPAVTICLFLSLSNSLKSFDLVYAMQGPSGYATGTVPFVMDIFFDAFAKKQAGLGTAKAILLFLLIALITGVQLSISKRREVQLSSRPAPRFRSVWILEAVMILAAFIWIYPALFVLTNSVKPEAEIKLHPISLPHALTTDNFVKAWTEMRFPRALLNTAIITVFGVAGIILVSSMAAWKLARTFGRLSWLLYLVFAFAMVIPFQIVMVPIVGLSTDLKLATIWGIIPMYWGLGAPLAVFMYHGFVKGVPRELEEAASIDGAGQFFVFFRVVFPLMMPITATIVILDALWLWNDFLLPLIVVKAGTLQLEQLHFYGMFLREYGPSAASLILSATPIVILYLVLQKYIIKGIAAGAVKG